MKEAGVEVSATFSARVGASEFGDTRRDGKEACLNKVLLAIVVGGVLATVDAEYWESDKVSSSGAWRGALEGGRRKGTNILVGFVSFAAFLRIGVGAIFCLGSKFEVLCLHLPFLVVWLYTRNCQLILQGS